SKRERRPNAGGSREPECHHAQVDITTSLSDPPQTAGQLIATVPLELPTFLVRAAIEDITSHEREWLEGHLAACVECANEAGAMAAAVESLRNVQADEKQLWGSNTQANTVPVVDLSKYTVAAAVT